MKNSVFRVGLCLLFLCSSTLVLSQNGSKELKDAYDFDYIYKLKMTNKKDHIQFDYYLKKDAGYFGFDISEITKGQEGMKMFTVMDNDSGTTGMFMEMMGKKMVQKSKIKLSDFDSDKNDSDFTFTQIGSKTILGYKCDGFIMENKDSHITVYITNEAPVSFSKMWDNSKTKMPKGFDASWMKKYGENGLMMEMKFVDKKKNKNNTTMECVGLEKTNFSIQASDYGSMLSAFGK
ncbi:DUF4412 domain-containing protein [Gelidibacter gilvus]|uniref:DUF4412 domain-containing protein n=1 Tax=Gelidibacter gilvus TaxID=59602 RepID=A0A4Q0XMS1_9FLAO|nr:DUF4412 domain-containing protein [Gelidibacter gilvus]RXJ52591.1 DUF4412 domain-containing protein [Gelidibacter gilvus]